MMDENDKFPNGLKVLAIDTNIVCLKYLIHLLQKCKYKVTGTTEAAEALRLLNDEKEANFDIIITNVVRSDMDGFQILRIVGLRMDIPVVVVSANEDLEMVKRGVMEGADAYLVKPVSFKELSNIWQHVLRRRCRKIPNPNNVMEQQQQQHKLIHISHDQTTLTNNKEDDERDQIMNLDHHIINNVASPISSSKKKHRVSWTKELHDKFLAAYEQLREKERVPNNILKLMNDPNLSRENVASHLQKHRDSLRKKKKASEVGKLVGQKNYNWMNQRPNQVSNFRPQLPILSGQFQFSNMERSSISMEEIQGNELNPQSSNWTAAELNYIRVPEFNWFNNSASNNLISKLPCDQYLGFGQNNNNNINPQYPLESKCLNSDYSVSQSFGNCPIDNIGEIIPDEASSLDWSFPNNSTTAGQCSQTMQFDKGNSHGNLLMDDDLSEIFKQFQSEEAF